MRAPHVGKAGHSGDIHITLDQADLARARMFWFLVAGASLAGAAMIAVLAPAGPILFAVVLSILPLLVTAWIMISRIGVATGISGPALSLTAAGFFDRRLMRTPVPWNAVQWQFRRDNRADSMRGGAVWFEIDPAHAHALDLSPAERVASGFWRAIGSPAHVVLPTATGYTPEEIAAMMARFKPAATAFASKRGAPGASQRGV